MGQLRHVLSLDQEIARQLPLQREANILASGGLAVAGIKKLHAAPVQARGVRVRDDRKDTSRKSVIPIKGGGNA